MNLVDAVNQFEQIVKTAKKIDNKKEMKKLEKEAKSLSKALRKVEKISVDHALHMQEFFSNLELGSLLNSGFGFVTLFMDFGSIQERNSEKFMDADAFRVRKQFEISSPSADEILRFKVKLSGFPLVQKWSLLLEQTREMMEISLPVLTYEGLAKLSPGLLYIDWIGGLTPKQSTYFLGPTYEYHPPKVFPFSMISSVNVPSADPKFDFGFVISSPTETSFDKIREFRKRNGTLDYHPLPEFLIRVKIDRLKGESKNDQQQNRISVTEFLKQNTFDPPVDVGWTLAYTRFLGTGFPPEMRGTLLPLGAEPPTPPPLVDYSPMTPEDYVQAVKERFDEDNIVSEESTIDDISVVYGGRWVARERTILTGIIPIVPTKDTVRSYCLSLLGVVDNVSLERIKKFSKSSVSFAKDIKPKGEGRLDVIPLLLAYEVDKDSIKWVKDTLEVSYKGMVAPSILDLKNGLFYYCNIPPFMHGSEYNNIRSFTNRYLITEEIRWSKPLNAPLMPKCPHCGALYRVKDGLSEVTCQNCMKIYTLDV
ncbi:MAG: hypothetical protein E3J86_12710 [Candidatus Thorarchaeota archaeon]|nr:MAG: hypothetical protein E3J86_12710 [Candidatus Thorarchaeota archaeon]